MEIHNLDGRILLRIVCGLFLFPHFMHKLRNFKDEGLRGEYAKAGLKPAPLFMALNMTIESVCGVLLIAGVAVKWAALVVAALLFIAARSITRYHPKGFVWAWPAGGIEYCMFWGLICVALAWLYW